MPILESLAYVSDVRDYIKKFCSNNEVNYKAANNLSGTIMTQINTSQKNVLARNQHNDPASHVNKFSVTDNNFYNRKGSSEKNSQYNYLNNNYRSSVNDNQQPNNMIYNNYSNNIMPVNKKVGFDATKNNSQTNYVNNIPKDDPDAILNNQYEFPLNKKSILPANKFSDNPYNESHFYNHPNQNQADNSYNNSNNNNLSILNNKSFNNSKNNFDDPQDLNNQNISINIINHNYANYYLNQENKKNRTSSFLADNVKDDRNNMQNSNPGSVALRNNNMNNPSLQGPNIQNKSSINSSNYNLKYCANYLDYTQEREKEKPTKYSNFNLFRSGNNNLNGSFGNNSSLVNNFTNRQMFEKQESYKSKNIINNNNNFSNENNLKNNYLTNPKNDRNTNNQINNYSHLNNFNRNLFNTNKQNQDKKLVNNFIQNNVGVNINNNSQMVNNTPQRYNSFLADKYSSTKINNNRPSSAVVVSHSNANTLSKYPISSQQIQSFINNNPNKNDNSKNSNNYQKSYFNNRQEQEAFRNSKNSNYGPNNNLSGSLINKKPANTRDYSSPNLRSSNNYFSKDTSTNNTYSNPGYMQRNTNAGNVNLINNPNKQKFGNNLSSSINNNLDLQLLDNSGNRTSRPGTSMNDNKNSIMMREFSIATPQRFSNNSNNDYFYEKNNFNSRKNINSNNGLVNKSFNALITKDITYEDFYRADNLGNKNFNNPLLSSRSVERTKFKPSTPNYHSNNNYFSNNNPGNMSMNYQKQNAMNNYSSLVQNFQSYQSNKFYF